MSKIKQDFPITGMSAPKSFTLHNFNKEDIFWATTTMTDDRYKALFNWAKSSEGGFWGKWNAPNWIAECEHDGLSQDGAPINCVVLAVRENN